MYEPLEPYDPTPLRTRPIRLDRFEEKEPEIGDMVTWGYGNMGRLKYFSRNHKMAYIVDNKHNQHQVAVERLKVLRREEAS